MQIRPLGLGVDRTRPDLAAHDFNTQRSRPPIQLFDPHKGSHSRWLQQNALGNALGQRFKQVQTLRRKLRLDRLSHLVVAQDAVHIIRQRRRDRSHLDNDIEPDPLRDPALGLKRPDFHIHHVVPNGNPVQRRVRRRCLGPRLRMRKREMNVGGHSRAFPAKHRLTTPFAPGQKGDRRPLPV